jgi:hypothetical protein
MSSSRILYEVGIEHLGIDEVIPAKTLDCSSAMHPFGVMQSGYLLARMSAQQIQALRKLIDELSLSAPTP